MTAALAVAFRGSVGGFTLEAAFEAPATGTTGLFGPSGCGKTTLLRAIAGLTRLPGRCVVSDAVWQDERSFLPAYRRPVGFVFQEPSLFGHLCVRKNLLYGAPAGRPERDDPLGFDALVDLLGLEPLLERGVGALSGGERQRVAIGRALLSRPKLLLMDEPLSALDGTRKAEILPTLDRLGTRLRLPILYVSHDMAEIGRLADHLVLMEAGRVVAAGPLGVLQSDLRLPLAAGARPFVTLEARVAGFSAADGLATLEASGIEFLAPAPPLQTGARKRLRIDADDVSLARERPGPSSILNVLPARILDTGPSGPTQVTAVLGLGPDGAGPNVLARVSRRSWDALGLAPGIDVFAQVKGVALMRDDP